MKFLTYLTTAYTNRIVQTSEEAYQRIMRNFSYIEECIKWNESFIVQMKENARSICGLACLCHRYGTIIKNWTLHHIDDNEEIHSYQLDEQTIKRLANTFENMIQENAMLRIYNKETHTIQSVPETYYDDAIFELLGSQPIMMKNFNQMCIKHDIPTIWAKHRINQHILKGTIKIIQNSELYAQRIIQKS